MLGGVLGGVLRGVLAGALGGASTPLDAKWQGALGLAKD